LWPDSLVRLKGRLVNRSDAKNNPRPLVVGGRTRSSESIIMTANHKRKTRMISFRVSDKEFDQLRTTAEARGARSVSDYARLALCGPSSEDDLDSGLRRLSGDVRQLSRNIQTLTTLIEMQGSIAVNGNGAKARAEVRDA
jgi:mobilization protein NikA